MASVQGPGRGSGDVTTSGGKALPSSSKAYQVYTKESLIAETTKKADTIFKQKTIYRWLPFGIGRWIATRSAQKIAKTEYIDLIKDHFIDDAVRKLGEQDKQQVEYFFNAFVKPKLMEMTLEDLPLFQSFINTKEGLTALISIPSAGFTDKLGIQAVKNMIDLAMEAMRKNPDPDGVNKIFDSYSTLVSMVKLTSYDSYLCLGSLLQKAAGISKPLIQHNRKEVVGRNSEIINRAVNLVQKNPAAFQQALATCPKVFSMMEGRLDRSQKLLYLEQILTATNHPNALNNIEEFLDVTQTMQNDRARKIYTNDLSDPMVYRCGELSAEIMGIGRSSSDLKLLKDVLAEISSMSIVTNLQALARNFDLISQPSETVVSSMADFNFRSSVTLSTEYYASIDLSQEGDRTVDLSSITTDFYLTNLRTGETRSLRSALPLTGTMTHQEAQPIVGFLAQMARTPYFEGSGEAFDNDLEKNRQLSAEQKSFLSDNKSVILKWVQNLEQEFGKCFFDFNPTQKRPKMSFAREHPITSEAIANPLSEGKALQVAQQRNIYNIDGKLSLLPLEIAKRQPEIAYLDPTNQATSLLQQREEAFVNVPLSHDHKARLTLKKKEVTNDQGIFLQLETTLRSGDQSHTRTTLYKLNKNETINIKIISLNKTLHLERDLLLAKAEFLELYQKRAVADIKDLFVKQAQSNGMGAQEAEDFFNASLKNKLLETSLKDLTQFKALITKTGGIQALSQYKTLIASPYGIECFLRLMEVFPPEKPLSAEREEIRDSVMRTVSTGMEINPAAVQRALATYPAVALMMESRFTPEDHSRYLDQYIKLIEKAESKGIDDLIKTLPEGTTVLDGIHDFFIQAQKLQNQRANIIYTIPGPTTPDKEALVNNFAIIRELPNSEPFLFLKMVAQTVDDMTVLRNTQAIHENIRTMFRPPSFSERTLPALEDRYPGNPFSISREYLSQERNLGDVAQEFQPFTDLYLTNKKTMETRAVHVKLPFSGQMTQKTHDHLLEFLEDVYKNKDDKDFDAFLLQRQRQLSPTERGLINGDIKKWVAEIQKEYARALFDFNATEARPKMSFAKEKAETAAALQDPTQERALKAAQQKNIYNIDGKLSLLPPEVAQTQGTIAYLDLSELSQAIDSFRKNDNTPQKLTLVDGTQALLKLQSETVTLKNAAGEDVFFIQLHTIMEVNGKAHTRTTLYERGEQESVQQKIESLINTHHFERDLLLAKAECYDLL